ncbi:MAG TPA: (d)CMP kinase [Candidatus Binatia bacterium]|nr:(d)CMP kinase [Candidatus Binatia bacterium]
MSALIIAIDGPSAAGKSTLAKRLAKELGFTYLDTGAMYRALALKVLREGIDIDNDGMLTEIIGRTEIDLLDTEGKLHVVLDGEDVSELIRTPEVSQMASKASALKTVRQWMLILQRALGERGDVVAEGRDIGTVVFPDAEVKIYLDASAQERARRRVEELRRAGRQVSLDETLREMVERDKRDSERALAPLCRAADAVAIDSSALDAETLAQTVMHEIRKKGLAN